MNDVLNLNKAPTLQQGDYCFQLELAQTPSHQMQLLDTHESKKFSHRNVKDGYFIWHQRASIKTD